MERFQLDMNQHRISSPMGIYMHTNSNHMGLESIHTAVVRFSAYVTPKMVLRYHSFSPRDFFGNLEANGFSMDVSRL